MTQHERILAYIDTFGSISPMEVFADLGITKLATRISEMRADGIEFDQQTETAVNRYGEKTHFARYSRPMDIDAINEMCLKCGKYKMEHEGACDDCKWKQIKYERQ